MEAAWLVAMRQAALHRNSRRALVALAGGLAAAGTLALDDDTDARKKRRRRKGKKNRKDRKAPKIRVAATCAGPGTLGSNASDGNSRIAQTFVALSSGALIKVQLPNFNEGGATDDFELRLTPVDASGIPIDEVLTVGSIANDQAPIEEGEVDFAFTKPFSLEAGIEYALVLTRPGGEGFAWLGEKGKPCPGRSFFSTDQNAPFEFNIADFDQTFTAFVSS